MLPLYKLTASEAIDRIASGELTSEALVRSCLDRIQSRDADVGAWAYLDTDLAISEAKRIDTLENTGPLHGIPVGVKDIINTVDMPTTQGSSIYAGYRPPNDAACVALLREAGAIILGKTVTTEFAAMTPGKTRNPHDTTKSPGGSSSGSAAAVSDFMVPLALGSQTIGSTIRPATYCGAVGFKGSYGSFNLAGLKPQAPSMDALGLMARTVADIKMLRISLLGISQNDEPSVILPPRIGIYRSQHWALVDSETVRAFNAAVTSFERAGLPMVDIRLGSEFSEVLEAQWIILMFECSRGLRYELNNHADALSRPLRELLEQGRDCSYTSYRAALELAATCRSRIAREFKHVDVILTPSAASSAPAFGAPTDLLFQRLWTVLHLPCITLPTYINSSGLPIGIQLVGRMDLDGDLLAIASWVETQLGTTNPV